MTSKKLRYISKEARKKLMEMAKARWARTKPKPINPAPVSATSSNSLISAIDTSNLSRQAGSAVAARGRGYFAQTSRFKIEKLTDTSAVVRVRGSRLYSVVFQLEPDGEVVIACECPYEDKDIDVICKHKIAAALFLKANGNRASIQAPTATSSLAKNDSPSIKSVKSQPEPQWRENLTSLLETTVASSEASLTDAILFFSFIRLNHQTILQPGVVILPSELMERLNDRSAISDYLIRQRKNLFGLVYQLQSYNLNSYRFVNAAPELQALARQMINTPTQTSYYDFRYGNYSRPQDTHLWKAMAHALVFSGDEQMLIKSPISVLPDIARFEVEAQRDSDGIKLFQTLKLADRAIKVNAPDLEVFNVSPLWLKLKHEVFQADLNHISFQQLRKQRDITIPREESAEFFQRYFPQLTTSHQLTGDKLTGEPISDQKPQPRIYLTEQNHQLRVLLRFAYGGFDCVAAKKPPQVGYAYDPENNQAIHVERQVEIETEWWTRLGSEEFGLM